jgi:hypothetical protein
MVEGILKEKLLTEAKRIGEEIYNKRKEDETGIYWETIGINFGEGPKFLMTVSENIYSGSCGIILFYIALYKITKDDKYINICKEAMNWVISYSKNNRTFNYSFITGRSSVAFVLMKMHEICGGEYLTNALEVMNNCEDFISGNNTACEFLNGAAGTLLVLLHLHKASNEHWLLEKINLFTQYLLDNLFYNLDGLHWDRSGLCIKSLCGFSHGAAGVGFVLLEMGNYFKNPSFYYLAEQAFKYESNYYNEKEGNWRDLRKSFITEDEKKQLKKAIEQKYYEFFYDEKYMSAWCHGSPGIGLTRLRAFELRKKEIYKNEYKSALEYLMNDFEEKLINSSTFTLCHGVGGNLDLAIEAYRLFYLKDIKDILELISNQMLNISSEMKYYNSGYFYYTGNTEDYSMFNGNAGIGYFYLRLINPEEVESVLIPFIKNKDNLVKIESKCEYDYLNFNNTQVKKLFIERVFKKTIQVLNKYFEKEYFNYLSKPLSDYRENELNNFIKFVESILFGNEKIVALLKDVYSFERKKLSIEMRIKSYALANYRYSYTKSDVDGLIENMDLLMAAKLQINPDVNLFESEWDWDEMKETNFENVDIIYKNSSLLLLIASHNGVREEHLSEFCFNILDNFKNKTTVNNVVKCILELFGEIKDNEIDLIKEKILDQIKILLKNGILIFE